jgi:trigger factor
MSSPSDLELDPNTLTETGGEKRPPLKLEVKVDKPQTCLRHVVVTVPRSEIERYEREAFDKLAPDATVPGFRSGRAPRKLIERAFKSQVTEQIKGSLVMDSLSQITDEQRFSAIGEPDFDYEAITLPESGDFTYEFTIEVRPEFTTPNWKGLKLKRQVESIDDGVVEDSLQRLLSDRITPEAIEGPAQKNDVLLVNIDFQHEGKSIHRIEEVNIQLVPRVTFVDGVCEKFLDVLNGVQEGERRKITVEISANADHPLAGKSIDGEVEVVEVSRRNLPAITTEVLDDLGGFVSLDELKSFVRENLTRQATYRQQRELRRQIVDSLTRDANWELPPELVKRQTRRELERQVLELRRNGFSDGDIQKYVNAARQNARASTEAALREHFILEQIAEDLKIEPAAEDYDSEIRLIAQQSDMPERRVRARLEKTGQMDALRNQIVERRVLELITEAADVADSAAALGVKSDREFAVDQSALGIREEADIPEAKYADEQRAGAAGATPTTTE